MSKKGYSRPGLFGSINHYDANGKKVGESRSGFFSGMNDYDANGKKIGHSDAIKKARLEKEKPVVEGFLSWLDQQSPIRGSRMDKAVTYIQNRRSYLSTYLEDGRCSFSNNLSLSSVYFYPHLLPKVV